MKHFIKKITSLVLALSMIMPFIVSISVNAAYSVKNGVHIWNFIGLESEILNFDATEFTNGTEYEYEGIKIIGGAGSKFDANGLVCLKTGGIIVYTPAKDGTLTIKVNVAKANTKLYVDEDKTKLDDNIVINGTATGETEGEVDLVAEKTYYIYNGTSNGYRLQELIFTESEESEPTPTIAPTATPTVAPTATPTIAPTATPTVAPTATPTVAPTATPTVAPTATPALMPTATPTVAPHYSFNNGVHAWNFIGLESEILNFDATEFTNGAEYEYEDLKIIGGAGSKFDDKGLVSLKTGGIIAYTPRKTGTLKVKINVAVANAVLYVDEDMAKLPGSIVINGTALGETEGEANLVGGKTYYIYNGTSNGYRFVELSYTEDKNAEPVPTVVPTPTVNPTQKPDSEKEKLSVWEMEAASDSEYFENISELPMKKWTSEEVASNGSGSAQINKKGNLIYTISQDKGAFYFTYKIRMTGTAGQNTVELQGVNKGTVLASPVESGFHSYTTVVDIDNKKAYTYNENGNLVTEIIIADGETVTGIIFANNSSNVMLVDEFEFGTIKRDTEVFDIVLRQQEINGGLALAEGTEYVVETDKFIENEWKFDLPYAVDNSNKKMDYIDVNLTLKYDNGNLPDGLYFEDNSIKTAVSLSAAEYPVTVTVNASYYGETKLTKNYKVIVKKGIVTSDDVINEYVPVVLNGETAVNENDIIVSNLTLPKSNAVVSINWSSSDTSVIGTDGSVTRQGEDTEVTLTADIASVTDLSKQKTYSIKVKVLGVNAMLNDAVSTAKASLVSADDNTKTLGINELKSLCEDVKLYTKYENNLFEGYNDVKLTWSTDSECLKINNDVAEIYPESPVAYNVNLIVEAEHSGVRVKEIIPVTVNLNLSNAADKYAVRCDDNAAYNFNSVSLYNNSVVVSDITVPLKGAFGSDISWTSTAPMYISTSGKYNAPSYNTNVVMSAVVSKGNVISDKTHTYTLIAKGKNTNSQGNSGGGGGGSYSTVVSDGNVFAPVALDPIANNVLSEIFSDLGTVEWAREAINALADKNIVSGRGDKIFSPDDNVTRAEFAKIVVNAFGLLDANAEVSEFSDVSEDDWYYEYIASAYSKGIIKGYAGTFGVNDNISRQDMAVIIYRAAQYAGKSFKAVRDLPDFADESSISDYAKEAVHTLYGAGVINGVNDTDFAPLSNATRAQAAKITYEVIK